ncbi:hypothetical protein AMECASPLE_024822 [Ameca splendens]|uniref:Uncharacterized protein n=1 Tax=Ameca splendens TaxID=208324 RepID=A0ABV1AAS3_9TELE
MYSLLMVGETLGVLKLRWLSWLQLECPVQLTPKVWLLSNVLPIRTHLSQVLHLPTACLIAKKFDEGGHPKKHTKCWDDLLKCGRLLDDGLGAKKCARSSS